MDTRDLNNLVKFRSALISELPVDSIFDTELDFDDMSKIMEIVNKVNTALSTHQIPVTESTTMNATMYDPSDVAFKQDKPVAKQFSKLDVLAGYTNDLRDDEPSRTQFIEQPISRDSLLPAYPPTPQNSSYANDLRNAVIDIHAHTQTQPLLDPEINPWDTNALMQAQFSNPSIPNSPLPPQVTALLQEAARHGNLHLVMQEIGLI